MRNRILALLGTLACTLAAQTPPSSPDADASELQALLNMSVTVASRKAMTTRESPGVISLITREEIQAMGARDLIDVLRMVPGMDFGYDVQGVVGASIRGLWGYEGKMLVLWDGVELNDTLYGVTAFGNHYPVDQIKRIEVIRGPGSSIYGGFAEVAVVQITSLGADDIKGGAGVTYGNHRQTGQAMAAWTGAGVQVTLGAFGGDGRRSDGEYVYSDGSSYSMKDQSKLRPLFVNLGVTAGDFQFRAIVDQYYTEQRDNLSEPTPAATGLRFGSTNLEARYAWKVKEGLTITPFVLYRELKQWWTDDESAGFFMYPTTRTRAGASLAWELNPAWALTAGLEGQRDQTKVVPPTESGLLGGADSISYTSKVLYGQLQYTGFFNVTVGARWEDHSAAGSAFVPRVGITKVMGRWHLKALYANSFRTPAIQNFNEALFPDLAIKSEKTSTAELEGGVQLGNSLLTVNVFDMRIKDPVVFTVLADGSFGYLNQESTGSRGVEVDWKYRQAWGFLNANFSHHAARNQVDYWAVPGQSKQFLGMAPTKATFAAGWKFAEHWNLGPSLVWSSQRYGYDYAGEQGNLTLRHFPAYLVLNGTVTYSRKDWTASLGLFDSSNQRVPYFQPYNGGHAPLPGTGRELVLKVRYGF